MIVTLIWVKVFSSLFMMREFALSLIYFGSLNNQIERNSKSKLTLCLSYPTPPPVTPLIRFLWICVFYPQYLFFMKILLTKIDSLFLLPSPPLPPFPGSAPDQILQIPVNMRFLSPVLDFHENMIWLTEIEEIHLCVIINRNFWVFTKTFTVS